MEIFNFDEEVPLYTWANELETEGLQQIRDLAKLPFIFHHVCVMPDGHPGYGMPIGGVIACINAVIPNGVGVDIGCGMIAIRTNLLVGCMTMKEIRELLNNVKKLIPMGEGKAHKHPCNWDGFEKYSNFLLMTADLEWYETKIWELAHRNLGTLGGGNHFIELQKGDDGYIWLMIHSGSRNLGYQIASYYNKLAQHLCRQYYSPLPNENVAFLPADSIEGQAYIRDMNFALDYAYKNRQVMMNCFKSCIKDVFPNVEFDEEINIHHNYATLENHFGRNVWIHRKGATSAFKDQLGIIPGSMGTASYIVKGKGNRDSFLSCSHGAGRPMSRSKASRKLTESQCNDDMKGIVFDRWKKIKRGRQKGNLDLSEAPGAYKNIEDVMKNQKDLVDIVVQLLPLGVLKG